MRAEQRGSQSASLPRQTETDRGTWENDISFRHLWRKITKNSSARVWRWDNSWRGMMIPTRGVGSCEVARAVCSLAQHQSCLWLLFTKNWWGASWLPGVCFSIIYHTQSALQLEKESWSWQSMKAGHGTNLPLFLVSTPPPRADNRPKPRRSQWARHGEAAPRMVRLVETACQDRHPPSVYSTPAMF